MLRDKIGFSAFKLVGFWACLTMGTLVWASDAGNGLVNVERITQSHTQLIQDLQNQINDMNQDIDTLRGQVQVLQYQLQQSIARQKTILLQLDNEQSKSADNVSPNENHQVKTTADDVSNVNQATALPAKTVSDAVPSKTSATTKSMVETKSTLSSSVPQAIQNNPLLHQKQFNFTGNDQKDYNAIIALILTDKNYYPDGLLALKEFVNRYPDSRYLANAYYWIGQLSYATGDKEQAIYYFATVVKDYPKSEKTQDAMYKVALLLQEKGQYSNAKAIYQQILKLYPTTPIAIQAQKQLDFILKQHTTSG